MKRLVCLISTEGKTPKQISDETMKAFEKYQEVESKVNMEMDEDKEGKIILNKDKNKSR